MILLIILYGLLYINLMTRIKFRAIYQDIDWNWQLNYGQQMGIGNKEYSIVKYSDNKHTP